MKKLIIILCLLIGNIAHSQTVLDALEFQGKVTNIIRDAYVIPTGGSMFIWSLDDQNFQYAADDQVWHVMEIYTTAEKSKLAGIEPGATADQSDAEIEAAYNNQVPIMSQVEAEAGTSTAVRRITAERMAQAIAALAGSGYSDELAQDAIGGILLDSPEINFTYDDATPNITAEIVAGSIYGVEHIADGSILTGDLFVENGTETEGHLFAVSTVSDRFDLIDPATLDNQTATEVTSTPTGGVAATNVQDAITELDAEHTVDTNTNIATTNLNIPGTTARTITVGDGSELYFNDSSGRLRFGIESNDIGAAAGVGLLGEGVTIRETLGDGNNQIDLNVDFETGADKFLRFTPTDIQYDSQSLKNIKETVLSIGQDTTLTATAFDTGKLIIENTSANTYEVTIDDDGVAKGEFVKFIQTGQGKIRVKYDAGNAIPGVLAATIDSISGFRLQRMTAAFIPQGAFEDWNPINDPPLDGNPNAELNNNNASAFGVGGNEVDGLLPTGGADGEAQLIGGITAASLADTSNGYGDYVYELVGTDADGVDYIRGWQSTTTSEIYEYALLYYNVNCNDPVFQQDDGLGGKVQVDLTVVGAWTLITGEFTADDTLAQWRVFTNKDAVGDIGDTIRFKLSIKLKDD